jgi:flagellar basal-body rod protein FlgG
MTTTGFKRQRAAFLDLIYQNLDRPGSASSDADTLVPSGIQMGLGVRAGAVYRMTGQGAIEITENPLDLAVTGEGYFQIELPNGNTAYTRDGTFQLNENGELVTVQGYRVEPGITIPEDAKDIDINANGEVLVSIEGQVAMQNLGQLELSSFVNPVGLEAVGDNLFLETEASGAPTNGTPGEEQFGAIRQGALEQSNVNVVEEITRLIAAQRAYEMNSNVISTSDEMMQVVGQLK